MAMTIRGLVPRDGVRDTGGALETVAREVLQGLEDEDLAVSFGIWEGEGGVQFVCRVETPPGDPLSSAPPWRWWSRLFRTPEDLRAELVSMVTRRLEGREESVAYSAATDAPSAAAS
jgi:hypothetical protein